MPLVADGMSLHRQLYLVLRDQIVRGSVPVGKPLPSEQALCELYDVSRITVRRALQDLSNDGYVVRRHGLGTFVTEQPNAPSRQPQTFRSGLKDAQLETTVEVIDLDHRAPPVAIGQALGIEATGTAVYVLRVRSRLGQPVMVTEAWLPMRFAEHLTKAALDRFALYELLERSGVQLGRLSQEVTAAICDPVRARLLDVDIGSPLLRIDRLLHDLEGDPVHHLTIFASSERSRLITEVAACDIDTATTGILAHDVAPTPGGRSSAPIAR